MPTLTLLLLALNSADQDQHHNPHFHYLAVYINSFCNNSILFVFAILPQHLCSLSTAGVQNQDSKAFSWETLLLPQHSFYFLDKVAAVWAALFVGKYY